MAITSIIRAPRGTNRREVQLADIVVPDVRSSPLFLPDKRWIAAVSRYFVDLNLLLASARAGLTLPAEFFVPDLYDTATKLRAEEKEMMLDMWHLGGDLAEGLGYSADYSRSQETVDGVGGTHFVLN